MKVLALAFCAVCAPAFCEPVDMGLATIGAEPTNMLPVVGTWVAQQNGAAKALVEDGAHWREGAASQRVDETAAILFPGSAKTFADAARRHASFPLAVAKDVPALSSGTVTVRFKPVAGREDQAAGIAFAIQPSGDYLILRANALENNLILFQFKGGRRSALKEVSGVPTKSGQWHELRLTLEGSVVAGAVDGKAYLRHDLGKAASGRIGLWSKADSVVQFQDLDVQPAAK
jgi:hypothetical protein